MTNEKNRSRTFASKARGQIDVWGVRLVSTIVFLLGIVNILVALQPAVGSHIEYILPLIIENGNRLTATLSGLGLFIIARSLWRRKQTAWGLIILLLTISLTGQLILGPGINTALTIALMLLLISLVRSFQCRSDPLLVRWGAIILVTLFVLALLCGVVVFIRADLALHQPVGLQEAFKHSMIMLASYNYSSLKVLNSFDRALMTAIYVVWFVTIGVVLVLIISPVIIRYPATAEERNRAKDIVEKYGSSSLARAMLYEDKSYFFSPGGSVLAFVEWGGGVLVLGDPIGPAHDTEATIQSFKETCARNDWETGYLSVLPEYLDIYKAAGFDTLCIGKEAIIPLATFTLQGNKHKNIRQTTSKMVRYGYKVEFRQAPLDDSLLRELRKISDAWLSRKVGGELSFTHGWFEDDYIRNGSVFVVYDPDGKPAAFANLIPEYKKSEITIDMMRQYPELDNGAMDLLYVFMLEWAKEKGYESFSLGVSPFVSVGNRPEDPNSEKIINRLAVAMNRIYNLKGIHFFKDKYHPCWEPRYMAYPRVASLPSIFAVVAHIYGRENLPWRHWKL